MTWSVIKEAIGKQKSSQHEFPSKIFVDQKILTNTKSIAENFNKFFTEVGPKLANEIVPPSASFKTYLSTCSNIQEEKPLSINELKDAFYALKINKSPGHDQINFNIIKQCFGTLYKPLHHIFNLFLEVGHFPDEMKIARVTPLFKGGDNSDMGNYRPISVLS